MDNFNALIFRRNFRSGRGPERRLVPRPRIGFTRHFKALFQFRQGADSQILLTLTRGAPPRLPRFPRRATEIPLWYPRCVTRHIGSFPQPLEQRGRRRLWKMLSPRRPGLGLPHRTAHSGACAAGIANGTWRTHWKPATRASDFARNRARRYAGTRQKYNPRFGLADPANASRTRRSSGVNATVVAGRIIFIPPTNHDSRFSDSGYSHVRHFKLQAQKFLACPSSCSVWPSLSKAGGSVA